ncbi:unnamed protein product [Staurois parvus]|uniref:Uncharacterized protein n=1 Tax=Staurois parvus TaxID=386267 RepID=A0ABN9B885_9NEOB|nr:unnamed protein product [Staurois parvus]
MERKYITHQKVHKGREVISVF